MKLPPVLVDNILRISDQLSAASANRGGKKDTPYHRDKQAVAHAAAKIEATRACLDQKELPRLDGYGSRLQDNAPAQAGPPYQEEHIRRMPCHA
jgi:hypothetical protein